MSTASPLKPFHPKPLGDWVPDPEGQWESRVTGKIEDGMTRGQAIRAVAREHPDLHTAYIVAHNLKHGHKHGARSFQESRAS